jgi:menaquinone-dependent protoporphyrinogen oxidase
MEPKILVTYGTKYASTAEIAEKIAQELRKQDLSVEVLPAEKAGDLSPYEAIVLGSAVYVGRWRKEAAKFLKANENLLVDKKVWLFSSGPTDKGDPEELLKGWRFPKDLQPIAERIRPRDIALFHGAVDEAKLNRLHKWMIAKVKAPTGDFRDWEAIAAWAKSIAQTLKNER